MIRNHKTYLKQDDLEKLLSSPLGVGVSLEEKPGWLQVPVSMAFTAWMSQVPDLNFRTSEVGAVVIIQDGPGGKEWTVGPPSRVYRTNEHPLRVAFEFSGKNREIFTTGPFTKWGGGIIRLVSHSPNQNSLRVS